MDKAKRNSLRESVARCCGDGIGPRNVSALNGFTPKWCSNFGCKDVRPLLDECDRLERENLNLLQELHEADSPEGKAYQSEVGRLEEERDRLREDAERAIENINSFLGTQLKDLGGAVAVICGRWFGKMNRLRKLVRKAYDEGAIACSDQELRARDLERVWLRSDACKALAREPGTKEEKGGEDVDRC